MRDASNEVTDMNMSERHVCKNNAAFAIDIMFVAVRRRCRRNGTATAMDAVLKPKPYSRSSWQPLVCSGDWGGSVVRCRCAEYEGIKSARDVMSDFAPLRPVGRVLRRLVSAALRRTCA